MENLGGAIRQWVFLYRRNCMYQIWKGAMEIVLRQLVEKVYWKSVPYFGIFSDNYGFHKAKKPWWRSWFLAENAAFFGIWHCYVGSMQQNPFFLFCKIFVYFAKISILFLIYIPIFIKYQYQFVYSIPIFYLNNTFSLFFLIIISHHLT